MVLLDIIEALGGIGIVLLVIAISIIILVIPLKIGISAVKGEDTEFGQVFLTGLFLILASAVISFAFSLFLPAIYGYLAGLLIQILIIKSRHSTTILGALGALLLYIVILVLIIFILTIVFPPFLQAFLDLMGI